ncbi:MAG: Asp-tRNA(Asn)/Glu-tRNA(Gln) amidotransferase subunit GatC [Kiritimatiellae bacterium]|nr:Asp-tRNA(Asn)/Glu-tRNA(Gln) amidotransferase subunit GatC [Kiritimatiellia bacterium]
MQREHSPDRIDIRHVAHLARLKLTDEELCTYQRQLEEIVSYVRKLQNVDLTGVEPTSHVVPLNNVLRADEVRASLDRAEVMQNAPAQSNGQFVVPKIVE